MPTFATPEPISVEIDLAVGDARITATDRADTVVSIRPSDDSVEADRRAAEQTIVDFAAGRLLIKAPKQRTLNLWGKPGSVDVLIELPTGSRVRGTSAVSAFNCVGRLGECRFKTATGDVHVEHTGPLDLRTAAGSVDVDTVDGDADVSTGSGRIRLREINGNATVKNSNGECWVGEIDGDLRVNTANGGILIGRANGDITAHTAMGDVRVNDVVRGASSLQTAFGEIEIGIHAGTAALLDVSTHFGRVRNNMATTDGPAPSEEKLEVHARTSYGDVVIHRA
jgi:hypothetical protein